MITESALAERGYHKHQQGVCGFEHAEYFMQQKFKDELGIRYFLEFVFYSPLPGGDTNGSWMCNLNINEPHCTFQQHRVEDITLSHARAMSVWVMLGKPYYEKYEMDSTRV